jgi:hypothetical protein
LNLKLATWNIHRCIGRDGVMSPERCAAVLKEINADIIALQEVESRPGHELDALTLLATETRSRAIAGVTMVNAETHYGNALLTRLPVGEVRRHDLSVSGREPRGALNVAFDLEGLSLQVIATHLGLRPAERVVPLGTPVTRLTPGVCRCPPQTKLAGTCPLVCAGSRLDSSAPGLAEAGGASQSTGSRGLRSFAAYGRNRAVVIAGAGAMLQSP